MLKLRRGFTLVAVLATVIQVAALLMFIAFVIWFVYLLGRPELVGEFFGKITEGFMKASGM